LNGERALSVAILVSCWIAFAALGFPAPHVDDVWYVDPAINVALTGRLEAPALERVLAAFGTRSYFLSFPLYPLLLGGWLSVFGVSTAALLAYWVVACVVASLSLRTLLKVLGAPTWVVVAAIAFFALHIHTYGFRPEASGYALAFSGAALLTRPSRARLFAGFLATFAAAACAPNFVVVAPGLAFTALYPHRKEPGLVQQTLVSGAVAGALVSAVFLLAIGGQLEPFLRQVGAMSKVTFSRAQTVSFFFDQLFGRGFAKLRMGPLYLVFLPLFAWAALPLGKRLPAGLRSFTIGIGLTLLATLAYRGRSFDVINPVVFACLALAATAIASAPLRTLAAILVAFMIVVSSATGLVTSALARRHDDAYYARVLEKVPRAGEPVVIDEYSARYVYDYRYPRNAISFHHQRALDDPLGFQARKEFKRSGEAWVVSPASLCRFAPDLRTDGCERSRVLGRPIRNQFADTLGVSVLE
jgi:hypothetical protein